MMYRCIYIIILLGLSSTAKSQYEGGIEQYHYLGGHQACSFMSIAHIQNSRQWYAEARYNYEDIKTFSLYIGKTFKKDNDFSYSFTPMVGASLGNYKGFFAGLNVDLEYKRYFFSAQTQAAYSEKDRSKDYIYNWSEVGYNVTAWVYVGISFQQTYDRCTASLEKKYLVGFKYKNYTIPFYLSSPFNKDFNCIVGIIWNSNSQK